jgi:hypothetical protein
MWIINAATDLGRAVDLGISLFRLVALLGSNRPTDLRLMAPLFGDWPVGGIAGPTNTVAG